MCVQMGYMHMCYHILHTDPKPCNWGGLSKDLVTYLQENLLQKMLWKRTLKRFRHGTQRAKRTYTYVSYFSNGQVCTESASYSLCM